MTDKRLETIARAIYEVSPAYYHGSTNPVPWDGAAPPYKEQVFREAQAAISADPVTEEVKRLVECLTKTSILYNYLVMAVEDGESFDGGVLQQHYIMIEAAQNELKKWSGE